MNTTQNATYCGVVHLYIAILLMYHVINIAGEYRTAKISI
jgi:hypothetical protein